MPTFKRGNMFTESEPGSALIVTGNATIKLNGALVMGRGAAKALRDALPGIDKELGRRIVDIRDSKAFYGLALVGRSYMENHKFRWGSLGILQVKIDYNLPAKLELIRDSLLIFNWWLKLVKAAHAPYPTVVNMNFPGIGYGKLSREQVLPLLTELPTNVIIWEY